MLTYNASDFIPNESGRVVFVVGGHEEVLVHGPLHDCHHNVPGLLDDGLRSDGAPKLEGVGEVGVFGG